MSHCHTIILRNGSEIFANIDSTGAGILFYERCTDQLKRSIPIGAIREILPPDSPIDTLSADLLADLAPLINESGTTSFNKWQFIRLSDGRTWLVQKDQRVRVFFRNSDGFKRAAKGRWVDLDKETLTIQLKKGNNKFINTEYIYKLRIDNPARKVIRFIGRVLIGVGLTFVILFGLFLFSDALALGVSFGYFDPNNRQRAGCLNPIVALVLGSFLLIFANGRALENPFDEGFQIIHPDASGEFDTKIKTDLEINP